MESRSFKMSIVPVKLDKVSIETADIMNESSIKYGFNNFINKNRDKLEIINNLPKSQQHIYLIINRLESKIYSNEENSLSTLFAKKVLKDNIELDNDFFKIWEMLVDFKILKDKKAITTLSIGENLNSFIRAISSFRDNKKDLYCAINEKEEIKCTSFKLEENDSKSSKVFKKEFIEKSKDHFKKKQLATLVTANGTKKNSLQNFEEQELYEILIGEIVVGLSVLEKNGTFIIKIFDMFTCVTLKLIMILSNFFTEVHIRKPFTSSDHTNEKYFVGLGYKENADLMKKMLSLYDKINNGKYIVDIFPDIRIPESFVKEIVEMNYKFIDLEYNTINKMYQFILDKNYHGVKYHEYTESQVKNSIIWMNSYV